MNARYHRFLKYLLIAFAVYGIILQWPLYMLGWINSTAVVFCFLLGFYAGGKAMVIEDEGINYGALVIVLAITLLVVGIKRVDGLYYLTHSPIKYCEKFPSGKYEDKAILKIAYKLTNDEFYFAQQFYQQKYLAAFIQRHSNSPFVGILESYSKAKYKEIKEQANKADFPEDIEKLESQVEEKYKPELEKIRIRLDNRWKVDSLAWEYVCDATPCSAWKLRKYLEEYLSYHPEGVHALEANETLVEILKDEVDD